MGWYAWIYNAIHESVVEKIIRTVENILWTITHDVSWNKNCNRWYVLMFPSQQIFQGCFNIVFRLVLRHEVRPRQINVETILWTSVLEFTTLNQRWINVGYIGVDINYFRQYQHNVVNFNIEFCNILQCRNNIVYTKICKKPWVKNKVISLSSKWKKLKMNTLKSKF